MQIEFQGKAGNKVVLYKTLHRCSLQEDVGPVLSTLSKLRDDPPEPLADDVSLMAVSETDHSKTPKPSDGVSPSIDWGIDASDVVSNEAPVSINWDVAISGGEEQPSNETPGMNEDAELPEGSGDAAGGYESGANGPPGINWDIDVSALVVEETSATGGDAPQINWEVEIPEPSDGGDLTVEGGRTIQWDIDLTETAEGSGPVEIDWDVGEECGGVKKGEEKGGVDHPLSKAEYRRALLDDLFEVSRSATPCIRSGRVLVERNPLSVLVDCSKVSVKSGVRLPRSGFGDGLLERKSSPSAFLSLMSLKPTLSTPICDAQLALNRLSFDG
jgi:hypothetical protein